MKPAFAPFSTRRAFTRREWLVGVGVALALLGLTATELRKSRAPVCSPGCSTCGPDIAAISEAFLANPSNRPPALFSAPSFPDTKRLDAGTTAPLQQPIPPGK
jgi:hypothetical protein